MNRRIDVVGEISRLHPERDCERIVFLTTYLEFPWDMTRALEFALFRTFAVPSIAELLDRTGEFREATQRRYDDTAIIVNEMLFHGFSSNRGSAFLERMNRIHGGFRIANGDFLYTLWTFVFVPIDWIDRLGWRPLTSNERVALFHFWREVGTRMGIRDIPETYDAFWQFGRAYEAREFANVPATRRVADATRDLLLGFYLPRALHRPAEPVVAALMDAPLLDAIGYPHPSPALRRAAEAAVRARSRAVRLLPKATTPKLPTLLGSRTHPSGYTLGDIGPDRFRTRGADVDVARVASTNS